VVIGGGIFAVTALVLIFSAAADLLVMPAIRGFTAPQP